MGTFIGVILILITLPILYLLKPREGNVTLVFIGLALNTLLTILGGDIIAFYAQLTPSDRFFYFYVVLVYVVWVFVFFSDKLDWNLPDVKKVEIKNPFTAVAPKKFVPASEMKRWIPVQKK